MCVGPGVGSFVGLCVGAWVGAFVGSFVGFGVGFFVGAEVSFASSMIGGVFELVQITWLTDLPKRGFPVTSFLPLTMIEYDPQLCAEEHTPSP